MFKKSLKSIALVSLLTLCPFNQQSQAARFSSKSSSIEKKDSNKESKKPYTNNSKKRENDSLAFSNRLISLINKYKNLFSDPNTPVTLKNWFLELTHCPDCGFSGFDNTEIKECCKKTYYNKMLRYEKENRPYPAIIHIYDKEFYDFLHKKHPSVRNYLMRDLGFAIVTKKAFSEFFSKK